MPPREPSPPHVEARAVFGRIRHTLIRVSRLNHMSVRQNIALSSC